MCSDQIYWFKMKYIDEMKDRTNKAKNAKSLIIAPTFLPLGPAIVYPHVYIIRAIIITRPTDADGIGKYMPATNKNTNVLATISTKFM